jgi:Ca2+-transporting ATPase
MSAADGWHATPVAEVGAALGTDLVRGLPADEARGRLAREGANELKRGEAVPPWAIFAAQFRSLVIWVLIGAAVVSALLGEPISLLQCVAWIGLGSLPLLALESLKLARRNASA